MRKLSDVSWGILEVLFDKQPKPSRHVPKHRQVSGFQEEVSLTWRGGYSRKTRSFVMTESDIPDHGRGGINYGEPARPESRAMNFGFGVIEFALRAAHLFSKDKGAPKKESYTPFIAIAEQPAASEAKPRTHDEREKIVDTLFGTGAKSEDSKLPLAGSQAVRMLMTLASSPAVPMSPQADALSAFFRRPRLQLQMFTKNATASAFRRLIVKMSA
jgi:hypothetical protein